MGKECSGKFFKSNQVILNEARDYLDGLMLGDGHIPIGRKRTSQYTQNCKHKQWLDKISSDLDKYNIESKVDNGRVVTSGLSAFGGSTKFELWTRSYVEFKEMRKRWYKKYYNVDEYPEYRWNFDEESGEHFVWKKIVPEDICLTPLCVANWYLGDGCLCKHTYKKGYYIHLSTDDFLIEDTIFLLDLLSEVVDIKCSVNKAGVIGIYNGIGVNRFINYIKEYKVNCYDYKFKEELINS